MAQWTHQVWLAIGIAFVIGLFFGYIILRFSKGNVKNQLRIEAELKQVKAKAEEQKQQLEQHFSQSATLLATLAEDYKKLYSHLAQTSEQLLPDHNSEFFGQAQLNKPETPRDNQTAEVKDYAEGSSGLLKS